MYSKEALATLAEKIKDTTDPKVLSILTIDMCEKLAMNMAETGTLLAGAVEALSDLSVAAMTAHPDPATAPKSIGDAVTKALAFMSTIRNTSIISLPEDN